jgi:PAS domain S-box-containing protein
VGLTVLVLDTSTTLPLDRQRSRVKEVDLRSHVFDSLGRAATVGIFHTDAEGMVTYVDQQWTAIVGLPAAESLGRGWAGAVHAEDRPRVRDEWLASTSACGATIECRVVRPSGEIRVVQLRTVAVFTRPGQPPCHIGTVEDVTSLPNAGRELSESRDVVGLTLNHLRGDMACELRDPIVHDASRPKLQSDVPVEDEPVRDAGSATESAQHTRDVLWRIRRHSQNLRPPLLNNHGLRKALLAHFERYTAQTLVYVNFSSTGLSDKRFAAHVETAVFRVIQESLANVARHARVASSEVEVRVTDNRVYIWVADRGRGFVAEARTIADAGLTRMQERVARLGGLFHVSSMPGEGTVVMAQIPFSSHRPSQE